ncbi:Assimilatory nitrite reductase [NAD(P)H] small subunit [wastewater metagenome]|uniref:Assimilatory nitrite reductase [NAD(P)H] small subunit n=3 Tax=root TaxID=1 RepID=A0A5B8RJ65_9ZZZZ|nr:MULTISPECIES: nitrite reductase small subunit NirD [Arhodomonas]MCS4502910.1 nitrite reductase small subunit NirD [Arhodomonas aquaeolei]QEA07604.1 assimilatory nitrite reductase [NAD(P)H] small subunit [uncultured organism]
MSAAVDTGEWVAIGPLDAIPRRGARTVETPDGPVAVFRTADDAVFAVADHCPHQGGPLSQGIVSGAAVYCPLHDWCIELATGRARAPDEGSTPRYPVTVEGGTIHLRLTPEAS